MNRYLLIVVCILCVFNFTLSIVSVFVLFKLKCFFKTEKMNDGKSSEIEERNENWEVKPDTDENSVNENNANISTKTTDSVVQDFFDQSNRSTNQFFQDISVESEEENGLPHFISYVSATKGIRGDKIKKVCDEEKTDFLLFDDGKIYINNLEKLEDRRKTMKYCLSEGYDRLFEFHDRSGTIEPSQHRDEIVTIQAMKKPVICRETNFGEIHIFEKGVLAVEL